MKTCLSFGLVSGLLILLNLSCVCPISLEALERESESIPEIDSSEEVTDPSTTSTTEDSSSFKTLFRTRCIQYDCEALCSLAGCISGSCNSDKCLCGGCPRVDPLNTFLRSILTSHLEPNIAIRRRTIAPFPSILPNSRFFPSNFHARIPDLSKLFDENPSGSDGVRTKMFMTIQQTCRLEQDCAGVCTNCTDTQCRSDNFCQCTGCSTGTQTDTDENRSNVFRSCRSARDCSDRCHGCVKTTCKYGTCECSMCQVPTEATTTTTTEQQTDNPTTERNEGGLEVEDDESSSTSSSTVVPETDIFSVRHNQTVPATAEANVCVPSKCNNSCWERQCSKWSCNESVCECDGCPENVSVIVKSSDGKSVSEKAKDSERYEVIF